MCAELANLNHCAALFLSRAVVNLTWYDSRTMHILYGSIKQTVLIKNSNNLMLHTRDVLAFTETKYWF